MSLPLLALLLLSGSAMFASGRGVTVDDDIFCDTIDGAEGRKEWGGASLLDDEDAAKEVEEEDEEGAKVTVDEETLEATERGFTAVVSKGSV